MSAKKESKPKTKRTLQKEDESSLTKIPKEALSFSVTIGGKSAHSDLQTDMLLGSRRENPFAINEALDYQTAQVALWGNLALEAEEQVAFLRERLDVIEAEAMELVRVAVREEIGAQLATIAMYDDAFMARYTYFYAQGEGVLPNLSDMKERAGEIRAGDYKRTLKAYLLTRWKLAEAIRKQRLIKIVHDAWDRRSFNITKMADIVTSMINKGILFLPKGVKLNIETNEKESVDVEDMSVNWAPPKRGEE